MSRKRIISTRDQLLDYIASNISFNHIARAVCEGEVENLGAFEINGAGGWVVRVQTILGGRDQFVGVSAPDTGYRLLITDVGPDQGGWKHWVGDRSEHELYRGDNPDRYTDLREKEIEDAKTKSS